MLAEKPRTQTLEKDEKMLEKAPEPGCHHIMNAKQTEDGIFRLIETLHDIRANSDPRLFARLWEQHVGRLEEIDGAVNANLIDADSAKSPTRGEEEAMSSELTSLDQTHQASMNHLFVANETLTLDNSNLRSSPHRVETQRIASSLNLSNEPFISYGVPLPQPWPRPLEPQIPATMSIFIQTSPPEGVYKDRAYHWLDAGVRLVDRLSFFDGLMMRVEMRDDQVAGYVFSYGWNDVSRWIAKTMESEGWAVLQSDLRRSADRGVRVWRMKVLVVGH